MVSCLWWEQAYDPYPDHIELIGYFVLFVSQVIMIWYLIKMYVDFRRAGGNEGMLDE